MKTFVPKNYFHVPKYFFLDANNKILGRFSTEISKLLRGKNTSIFTSGINLGNYVIIINTYYSYITGKKNIKKLYYKSTNRPGNLKYETYNQLKIRLPLRIVQKSVIGMLPKTFLGREYFKQLYIYITNPFKI